MTRYFRGIRAFSAAMALAAAASAQVAGLADPLASRAFRDPRLRLPTDASGEDPSAKGRAARQAFRERHGSWAFRLDRRGGAPLLAEGPGIPWIPGPANRLSPADVLTAPRKEPTDADLERIARAFVDRWRDALGVGNEELRIAPASREIRPGFRLVEFDRVVSGLPLDGARLSFRISGGNLVQIGGTRLGGRFDRELLTPRLDSEGALGAASRHAGVPLVARSATPLALLLSVGDPDEAWRGEPGDGAAAVAAFRLIVTSPGLDGDWEALVDATSGDVLSFRSARRAARVSGGVFPFSDDGSCPTGCERSGMPMPYADVAGGTANGAGVYAWTDGQVTTLLAGPYVRMSSACGAVSASAPESAEGELDLGTSGGTDCTVPPGASAGDTHAARTAYYALNRISELARGWLPGNPWLEGRVDVAVDKLQSCNAFWNGTLSFFRSSSVCRNSGENLAILDHEWGHGLDANDGGPGAETSPSEAYADAVAMLHTGESCIGRGFLIGSLCGGYGDPCLSCDGARDLDWNAHTFHVPHSGKSLPSMCWDDVASGPCGREDHCESAIASESLWDLVARDLPAAGLSREEALTLATELFTGSAGSAGPDLYNCSGSCPSCTTDGCSAGSWFTLFRALDDRDGDLTNGTPHAGAIFAAFARHGIACGSAADAANRDHAECSIPAAPAVTPQILSEAVRLTWAPVPGALSYRVFRSDLLTTTSGAIAGETTAPTFLDTVVANGVQYHYRVQGIGTAGCGGALSPVASVVPRRYFGQVRSIPATVSCVSPFTVRVDDDGPTLPPSVTVRITSPAEPAGETLVLTAVPGTPTRYEAAFATAPPPAVAGDGAIAVVDGDLPTLLYSDPDDGSGLPATATGVVVTDCRPPVLGPLTITPAGSAEAAVSWPTDEPANSRIDWGDVVPSGSMVEEPDLVTSHLLRMRGLAECGEVLVVATSTDAAGNSASSAVVIAHSGRNVVSSAGSGAPAGEIRDASTFDAPLVVTESRPVADVDVRIDLTHGNDSDLLVELFHPDGSKIRLFSAVGGTGDDFVATVLDDESPVPIANGTAPFTARFRPAQSLTSFDRKSPLGTWLLRVSDTKLSSEGMLQSWGLDFQVSDVAACTSSDGFVELDATPASCSAPIAVRVVDADLSGSVAVTLTSGIEPAGESVVLAELAPGELRGSIPATPAPPVAGDGLLSLVDGDLVTALYVDADDGHGGAGRTKRDTRAVDCAAPVPTSVDVEDVRATSARLRFSTAEPAIGEARLGSGCGALPVPYSESGTATLHDVLLDGLRASTTYSVQAAATDLAGNGEVGACLSFTTAAVPPEIFVARGDLVSRRASDGTPLPDLADDLDGLRTVTALAFTGSGDLVAADFYDGRIWRIAPDGTTTLLNSVGSTFYPASVAVRREEIWVASSALPEIRVFDLSGRMLRKVAAPAGVKRIAFAPSGEVAISVAAEDRLELHSADGTFLRLLADRSSGLSDPAGVAWHPDRGRWFVLSRGNGKVLEVDGESGWLGSLDAGGSGPDSIAVFPDGELLVTTGFGRYLRRLPPDGSAGVQLADLAGSPSANDVAVAGVIPWEPGRGRIRLSPSPAGCSAELSVALVDSDLDADPSAVETRTQLVTSSAEPAGEPVPLVETGPSTGVFTGHVRLSSTDSAGVLLAPPGGTVAVTYLDANPAEGTPTSVSATVAITSDCAPPRISGLAASPTADGAWITWFTDEPASGRVSFGTPALDRTADETRLPSTHHEVRISGLPACTPFRFGILCSDAGGNRSVDDAGGIGYLASSGSPRDGDFPGSGTPVGIPDSGTVTVSIPVSIAGTIESVSAYVRIDHSKNVDLELRLTAPDGSTVLLASGESGAGFDRTVFDDAAATSISEAVPPFFGSFRPREPLARFIGLPASGSWQVRVTDRAFLSIGDLWEVSLDVRTSDASACTSSAGSISIDALTVGCDDAIGVVVRDADLSPSAPPSVRATSASEPAGEAVTLAWSGSAFTGSIPTAAAVAPGDGKLALADGDAVDVTYVDADDGAGHSNVPVVARLAADCDAPTISDVVVTAQKHSATVTVSLDEAARVLAQLGSACGSGEVLPLDPGPMEQFVLDLRRLEAGRTRWLTINATDAAGNAAVSACVAVETAPEAPEILLADSQALRRFTSNGVAIDQIAFSIGGSASPTALLALPNGDALVALGTGTILRVSPEGQQTAFAISPVAVQSLARSPAGEIYAATDGGISVFSEDAVLLRTIPTAGERWIAFSDDGTWVGLDGNSRLHEHSSADADLGILATIPGTTCWLLAFDPIEQRWILRTNGGLQTVKRDGTLSGLFPIGAYSLAVTANGDLLTGGYGFLDRYSSAGELRAHHYYSGYSSSVVAVRTATPPQPSRGRLSVVPEPVGCSESFEVTLVDADADADPSVPDTTTVTVRSTTSPAATPVVLTETGPSTGVFSKNVTISATPGAADLLASPGDLIEAFATDANDGSGEARRLTDTTRVGADCTPPQVTAFLVQDVHARSVVIWFTVSENAYARIEYESGPGTERVWGPDWPPGTVYLSGLTPCSILHYRIVLTDLDGNVSRYPASGPGSIHLWAESTPISADFETESAGWSHSGAPDEWERGIPTSGPGSAHGGTSCYATDLDGPYDGGGVVAMTLTTQEISIPSVGMARFSYWFWIETGAYDGGWLELSSDGGASWGILWPAAGYGGTVGPPFWHEGYVSSWPLEWRHAWVDLPAYLGPKVRIRFRFWGGNSAGTAAGWYVDDVKVVSEFPCPLIRRSPPSAVAACAGKPISLSVDASGCEPLTYQWKLDGSNVTDGGGISGSTTSTLTLSPVDGFDGNWTVAVTDGCGASETSSPSALSFTALDDVAVGPFPLTSPIPGATGVGVSTTLDWWFSTDATRYELYLGPTSPPPFVAEVSVPSFQTLLAPSTTYYWRVEARPDVGRAPNASTPVSVFTTGSASPAATSVAPSALLRSGPTVPLVISGNGFTPNTSLDWSGPSASPGTFVKTFVSSNVLRGTFTPDPAARAGRYDLRLKENLTLRSALPRSFALRAFTDVTEADWYFDSSDRMVAAGILGTFAGTGGTEFRPTLPILRSEMAEAVVRAHFRLLGTGVPSRACLGSFPDVPCGHPQRLFVEWAKDLGIALGGTDGLFHPDSNLTRAEMAAFLDRLIFGGEGSVPKCADEVPWGDDAAVPAWAKPYVDLLAFERVTTGCTGGANPWFCPGGLVQRSELATFLARILGDVPKP